MVKSVTRVTAPLAPLRRGSRSAIPRASRYGGGGVGIGDPGRRPGTSRRGRRWNEVGFPSHGPGPLFRRASEGLGPTRFWCNMPKQPKLDATPGKKPPALPADAVAAAEAGRAYATLNAPCSAYVAFITGNGQRVPAAKRPVAPFGTGLLSHQRRQGLLGGSCSFGRIGITKLAPKGARQPR